MRVAICSKRDLSSLIILNDLLPRLANIPDCEFALLLAVRTRDVETKVPELIRMKFLERDLPFERLFPRSSPYHDARAKDGGCLLDLAGLERAFGLKANVVHSPGEADEQLLAFRPDLILSVRFSFMFRELIRSLPQHGIINVHPGRVPDYAGLYPHFFSMLAGEETLGCTVHFVDAAIDSGAIIATGEIPIDRQRSAFAHNLDSHLLGNRFLAEKTRKLALQEPLAAWPQQIPASRPNTYPTREEFDRFHEAGLSLIYADEYTELLRRFGILDGIESFDDTDGFPAQFGRSRAMGG